MNKKFLVSVLFVVFVFSLVVPANAGEMMNFAPVVGIDNSAISERLKTNQVMRVSVAGVFSSNVVQSGDGVPNDWSLGQYATARNKGAIGMLAHNYLAGMYFYSLYGGQEITVKYSDGTDQVFVITKILRYKATNPNDFSQPFVSNNGNGSQVSAMQVFNQAYKNGWVTLQTCIAADGYDSWGLLFVQASPKK